MKFKFNAGAEIDLLTKDELSDSLAAFRQAWVQEVARGDRYPRFSLKGAPANASGDVVIGGPEDPSGQSAGPADGYVWAMSRISVCDEDGRIPNGDVLVYLNDTSPGSQALPFLDSMYHGFNGTELVLYPGDELVFRGINLDPDIRITVNGQARELPLPLAWRLGA